MKLFIFFILCKILCINFENVVGVVINLKGMILNWNKFLFVLKVVFGFELFVNLIC